MDLSGNRNLERVGELKKITLEESVISSIRVNESTFLVPVGEWILKEREIIEAMSSWRSNSMGSFFRRFKASPESMAGYLERHSVGEANRVLFLVKQADRFVGHLGFSAIEGSSAELDNVLKSLNWLRREDSSSMRECLRSLIEWANGALSIENFSLMVLSTNSNAVEMYQKLGFSISQQVPVKLDPNCEWGSLIDDEKNMTKANSMYRIKMSLKFPDKPNWHPGQGIKS